MIIRASGTTKAVLARHVCNRRLADAINVWVFAALSASSGARAYDAARRRTGQGPPTRRVLLATACLTHDVANGEMRAWALRAETEPAFAA